MRLVASALFRPPTRGVHLIPPIVLGGIFIAALLAGCASDDDDPIVASSTSTAEQPSSTSQTSATGALTTAPVSTTTGETPLSTEPVSQEVEVTAAVESFWDLYLELGSRTEAFDPEATRSELETLTTGEELQTLFDFLQSNALARYIIRGDIESSLTVLSADADRAEVRDCYDDTTGLYRIDTGERLDTDDPQRHQVVLVLVNEDGSWKVERIRDEGLGCTVSP